MKSTRRWAMPKKAIEATKPLNRSDWLNRLVYKVYENPELLVLGLQNRLKTAPSEYGDVGVTIDVKALEKLNELGKRLSLSTDTIIKLMVESQM